MRAAVAGGFARRRHRHRRERRAVLQNRMRFELRPDAEGGTSGPLTSCFAKVRICAATGGSSKGDVSRDCVLTRNPPPQFLLSAGGGGAASKATAVPAPLRYFEGSAVCSDTFEVDSCLQPLQVWFPRMPDPDVDAASFRACCTPPASCPSGSPFCASACDAARFSVWLELEKKRRA